MIRTDKSSVSYLFSLFKQLGVLDIVVCPGSRNLPIVHAFSSSKDFTVHAVIDERSAGFIALGLARSLGKPVPVVTTSGSAVLNLAPALLEAFYERIPMIAITADRPKEYIDRGENQTFNQLNVFENYIVHQVEISENIDFEVFEILANRLYPYLIDTRSKGPVHINMPFSEPLLSSNTILGEFKFELKPLASRPPINLERLNNYSNKKTIIYNSISNTSSELEHKLLEGVNNFNWIVINDLQSNVYDDSFINYFDKILASNPELSFEVLITIGDQMLSKAARNYFKSLKKLTHIDISPYPRKWDIPSSKYMHFQIESLDFINKLLASKFRCLESFHEVISSLNLKEQESHKKFFNGLRYKEFSIIEYIVKSFTAPTSIFWGNSSIVRYANWATRNKLLTNLVNRGISGIDGVLSTAIGYQARSTAKDDFYVVLGDISLLYESNALQSIHLVDNLKIIILNNGGGMIFKTIHPKIDDSHPVLTKHEFNFYHLSKMYDLEYFHCDNLEEFKKNFQEFKNLKNTKAILEISFPADSNSEWISYFKDTDE